MITVYYGGTYREIWTPDYKMSVEYEARKTLELEKGSGEEWVLVGGDPDLLKELQRADENCLARRYISVCAELNAQLQSLKEQQLTIEDVVDELRLPEDPLAGPELFRILLDEFGMRWEDAFNLFGRLRVLPQPDRLCAEQLRSIQPRTAALLEVLREKLEIQPIVFYHVKKDKKPAGAVCCKDAVKFQFSASPVVTSAELLLTGKKSTRSVPMEKQGNLFFCSAQMGREPEACRYIFRLNTAEGVYYLCADDAGFCGTVQPSVGLGFRQTVYLGEFHTPQWFHHAVMYQIFPDRFARSEDDTAENGIEYHKALGQQPDYHLSTGEPVKHSARPFEKDYSPDDFYGGTLRGIEGKLPYLKELGISCIYLNPIVEAKSNHRYDASDYLKVDPILGTNEDFSRLCAEAGKLGISIILDGVYSHTGADSLYFNRDGHYPGLGACQGEESPYYSWFDFRQFPNQYRSWWGFKDLPEVNELNPQWQDFILSGENSVVKTWLRRGAAGWRIDVADELPDEALVLLRKAVKEVKPDAPIIGEVWEDAVEKESYGKKREYALGVSLDSVMNYPLRTALLDFIHKRKNAFAFRDFLLQQELCYPAPLYYSLMNILGTHDTERVRNAMATDVKLRGLSREEQMRVVFSDEDLELGSRRELLAAAILYALPGVPSLYYGDEQGMTGVNDPFNRAFFEEKENGLYSAYKDMITRRNTHPELRTGGAEFYAINSEVLLILRKIRGGADAFGDSEKNGSTALVVNRGGERVELDWNCGELQIRTVIPGLSVQWFYFEV